MAILRTACCDICGEQATEIMQGGGWAGWSILQGISATKPQDDQPLTTENMSMMLCPKHTQRVAQFIEDDMQGGTD